MADSEKAPEQQQQTPAKNEGANNDSAASAEELQPKQLIAEKVTGTVKWFNVKSGYGFINRHDTKEDVFVHQTAILKNNPKKAVRSVGDGETVEFDVVLGDKGNEASNVTGPSGEPVQGSQFAPDKRRGRLYRPRRRTQTGGETGGEGDGGNVSGDGAASGDKKPRTRRFRGQGQGQGQGGQGQGQGRRFGGPGRFRRGGPRRSENGELNGGEGNEGGTGESAGEGDGNQNGRPKRFQNRRFRPRNSGPRNSENNADGGQQTEGGNNENGQKPRRSRRFNRNKKNSGSNQDGGQEVQNTVTESQA